MNLSKNRVRIKVDDILDFMEVCGYKRLKDKPIAKKNWFKKIKDKTYGNCRYHVLLIDKLHTKHTLEIHIDRTVKDKGKYYHVATRKGVLPEQKRLKELSKTYYKFNY